MTQKVLALVLFFGTLLPLSAVAEDSAASAVVEGSAAVAQEGVSDE